MFSKNIYDQKHQLLQLQIYWALLDFTKKYKIYITINIEQKLFQQYVDSFIIIKRIENLTYQFVISKHWRIHFVISIMPLKSSINLCFDSFNRVRTLVLSISMKEKTEHDHVKFYEMKKIIDSRQNQQRNREYLIR